MKQKIYILGLITALIIFTGTIFKINHFPGASILLTVGLATMVLIFLPVALADNYRAQEPGRSLLLYIVTWLTCFVVFTAMLFKIQHWPYAGAALTIAIPFPYVVFLPVFLIITSKNKNFNVYNTVFVLSLLAINSVFSALLALNVSKTTIDDSYTLSQNYNRLENILAQFPENNNTSDVDKKIDEVLKVVNDYQNLILKHEGITREAWLKDPRILARPDSRQIAQDALLKSNEEYAGQRLESGLRNLILEFEKYPELKNLASSAPLIFDYKEHKDRIGPSIFELGPLAWNLIYLDGLEANLTLIKETI
jgi:hypothetical protein